MFRLATSLAMALLGAMAMQPALAAEADPCTRFTWDVTRELAVMKQEPQSIDAALKPSAEVPLLRGEKLYDLKLAAQGSVTFVQTPAKPTLADGTQAGLVRFRIDKPGRYRVSITSGHWIDVLDQGKMVKSRDFQGQRGCERPHKIVEYDLPSSGEMILQLSGAPDASVLISITAAPAPAAS